MWRSLLYVPANVPRFLDKAQNRDADAIILDLEDSVPDSLKDEARRTLSTYWPQLKAGPSDLIVRINADLRRAIRDMEMAVQPGLSALYLPKVTSPEMVRQYAAIVEELEVERQMSVGSVRLIALIETPAALEAAFEIASADERLAGLSLGSEDFATACGMLPKPENLHYARQRIVFAARAAGIAPLGLLDSVANMDKNGREALITRSREFGFEGATAIHPDLVPFLNDGFMPSRAEKGWARGVVQALEEAEANGTGAALYKGNMVDRPMLLRAKAILERYSS
ncbi:HpcH/HpaI aldolase/citrate lyase family protein [Ahrensia marina]|uniref:HpcH/HpaI aldolase/citrate lyase domain-containing protein n=1 Tax=Ahrensia marina TaxID=1514904 RepID=A0A0N0VLR6_9HYPH|nr:CoA ester lyase [Ahrensia marina]KPB00804.1 hypothetical protein SU32_11340 [Ahrensia marina]